MAGQASDATTRSSELALAAYLDDLAAGRRVLWLGDASPQAADRLAGSAESVMVLAPNPPPKDESRHRAARISALRPGPLAFRPGSFDVVVVPSLDAVGMTSDDRVQELRDLLDGRGVLVAGTPAAGGIGYEALFELLADAFDSVRMVGQAPLSGWTLVDLEAVAGDYDVTFDGSLMDDEPQAERWLAVAGFDEEELEAYCVVQVPATAGAPASDAEPQEDRAEPPDRTRRRRRRDADGERGRAQREGAEELSALEERLGDKQAELDAAHEHAEAIETTLAERSAELERLRERLEGARDELAELRERLEAREEQRAERADEDEREPSADAEVVGDYDRLERGLAEQGARVLELEREVERRGTLVRDLVEELRDLRDRPAGGGGAGTPGGGGGASRAQLDAALERAVSAEAARAEAQFQIDELMGRLATSDDGEQIEALRTREAELTGTVRGLRSRIAEVEELRELAEGRLSIVALDLDEQKVRNRDLERQLGELREQLELELVRARGEPGKAAPLTEGEVAEREAALRASENRLSERVGALSGQLVACRDLLAQAAEERDHARAEELRLTALVSSLQDRFDGARRGYEARIAEMIHDGRATDDSRRLAREVDSLRGERDGLRHRLADAEASLAAGGAVDARVTEAVEERDRARAELDRLRRTHADESARVTDAEDRARRESERAEELTASAGAREALVTRLQMDLAQEEGRRRDLSQRLSRAEEENDRLRGALVDASARVDEALDAEQRVDAAESLRRRGDAALQEARAMLATLADGIGVAVDGPRREITAVGVEAPANDGGPGDGADAQVLRHRVKELEGQLTDQDTLMRSLTAQIEERDDRVRALERRLDGVGVEGDEEALRREVMELQERAARLSDELLHERKARRAAEAGTRKRAGSGDPDVRTLHERLGQSDAELLLLKGQQATAERDLKTIRDACAQARSGLEELLGSATSSGDPATAERIGSILRLLNRF